jgi:hypothetical protein
MRNDLTGLIEKTRRDLETMIHAMEVNRSELSPSDYNHLAVNAAAMLMGANVRLLQKISDL